MGDEGEPWVRAARDARAAVEAALRRRDVAPRVRERLEMVKAVALGHPLAAIAAWSGRTERTVRRWLAAFARGGRRRAGRCAPRGAAGPGGRRLPGGADGGRRRPRPASWGSSSTPGPPPG